MRTKEIKQKIKSVGNIKKITKTMEMVSVSKMRKAMDKASSSRIYARYALELLIQLSKGKDISHPFMQAGKGDKELIVVIAGNKGLCGGYNSNIFKALNSYIKKNGGSNLQTIAVGKYGEKICRKLNLPIFASFINFSENSPISQTKELSQLVSKEFYSGEYKSIKILYTEFIKSTSYKPALREIFPINPKGVTNLLEDVEAEPITTKLEDFSDYLMEPSIEVILQSVVPGLVDVIFYQSLAESFASEHSARMFAMKNAGDNATTILDSLMLSYNHARQDGITRELSEIVAGAEALSVN